MARSSAAPTMIDATRNAPPARKSLWIPALFFGLMLLVVAVNGTMIFFAQSTFSGLDNDKAYQAGNEYNATLKEAAASAALGWTATTGVTSTADGRHLNVAITDKNGQPVQGLQVIAHLIRPVSTAFDQRLILRAEGNGVYGTDVTLPANGNWELRLSAQFGATDWQVVQRIFVK